ncbi:TniB family NTP-binding protein [Shewanella corallii]|uniref:TniB family NTP-binding protein n=1 Tax=Shewanella corallii TaxID=560080 RepID=A0ABT0ND38_9GAMM|nr:TniB family NTP-binding protein [Shewanella corallii]MCL2916030.1 TniB family NTP-binding protein [Shewanella corallii]
MKIKTPKIPNSIVQHRTCIDAWEMMAKVHAMYGSPLSNKGLLIYGNSGQGKTYLAEQYIKAAQAEMLEPVPQLPVLYHRFRESNKTISQIQKLLIGAMGATPPRGRLEPGELHAQLCHLIDVLGVQLIVLDEIQQVLPKSDGHTTQATLKYFCCLLDELPASIVFIGSERAQRLLKFGMDKKTIDDNEQLSRRMLRSVKLESVNGLSPSWLNCVNWFLSCINYPSMSYQRKHEAILMSRIYVAYAERGFSTLDSLFLREPFTGSTFDELREWLKRNFDTYCNRKINPFDPKAMTDKQAYELTYRLTQKIGR